MMEAIIVPATLDSLARISDFIVDAATRAGLDEHTSWQVQLAVDEAATNVIQHGYSDGLPGEIELSWRVDGVQFAVTLRDQGRRFDPTTIPKPDISSALEERQPGGLGIYLMHRLMDTVRFDYSEERGNTLTMSKRIGPAVAPARVFNLSGRLDAMSTAAALAQVRTAVTAGTRNILLDLAGVEFMSSSGLSALLQVRKDLLKRGGELRLCELRPQVYEVFSITGFNQVFPIHRTRDDAIAAFGQDIPPSS